MRVATRVLVVAATVGAMLGPASAARADFCNIHEGAVEYLWCETVGGCIAKGPVAIDPVICD